ncbi:MAG: MBL fold metallo-hydrolase [Coriobacteriales bacterium]|nr:MBL fold metallo-hydrolase [Coriobacteriales bacterium]
MTPHIHLYVLSSGSKGNATVVEGPTGSILVDCGISRKALHARADEVGCDLARVQAILVTHEHWDHTSGLPVVARHFDGPIFATAGTASGRKSLSDIEFSLVDHDSTLNLCGMRVQAFPTSHDVNDPMGFRFEVRGTTDYGSDEVLDALGWATDTGYLTDAALDALYGCRVLGLEANHDPRMLATGPYPWHLKRRVGGETGHLSNEQAAEALPHLVTHDTETIVALHLSQENNRPSIAVRTLAQAVGATEANSTFTEARTADGLLTVCAGAQDKPLMVW